MKEVTRPREDSCWLKVPGGGDVRLHVYVASL